MKIVYKKVFLDTNPIIYLLENQEPYSTKVKSFLVDCIRNKSEFYTTTITDTEFMVKPFKENKLADIETYKSFLKALNVLKCYINDSIAEQAAKLRVQYENIKLADAIQLAASMESGCDAFLTNDKQLKQVSNANVVYLGDL